MGGAYRRDTLKLVTIGDRVLVLYLCIAARRNMGVKEVEMTYTARPQASGRVSDTGWHVVTAILAIVGIVAAALGTWMAYGPDDGILTLFGWTWNVADITEVWAPILMIGGGGLAALTMGIESTRDWGAENSTWIIWLEAFAALVGIAAVVVGIVFLF